MSPAADVVAASERIFDAIETVFVEAGEDLNGELRERALELATHSANVAILAAVVGPEDPQVRLLRQALGARMASLEAGASIRIAAAIRSAIRQTIIGAIEIALGAVI